MSKLSQNDVEALLNERSPVARAALAAKVGAVYEGELRPAERALAEDIFKRMLQDIDVRVRQAVSDSLKANPRVPRDVAMTIANDVAEVAVPMLSSSMVFTDQDLIEIVRSRPATHQIAIAGRPAVSEQVSDSLIETGNPDVATTVLRNPGADVSEEGYGKVIDFFSGEEMVMEAVVDRPVLPSRISERLVTIVSEHLRLRLALEQQIAPDIAEATILQSRERVTFELWPTEMDPTEVFDLIEHLFIRDRLTDSLIMRAVCEGDFVFFTAALARRAHIFPENAWALIHDENELGLAPLCEQAGLGEEMRDLAYLSVRLARSIEAPTEVEARWQFRKDLVRHFSAQWPDLESGDVETLITRLIATGVAGREESAAA